MFFGGSVLGNLVTNELNGREMKSAEGSELSSNFNLPAL